MNIPSSNRRFYLSGAVLKASLGLSMLVAPIAYGGSNPPVSGTPCSSDGPCQDKKTGGSNSNRNSLSFSINLGKVTNVKSSSFLSTAKAGAVEGVRGGGSMRSFRTFFDEAYRGGGVNRLSVRMDFEVPEITASTYDPAILSIRDDGNYTRIEDQGFINQVLSDDALTHVDKLANGAGFRIRVWSKEKIVLTKPAGQKLYNIPSEPTLSDITFRKPDNYTGTDEMLIIKKEKFGSTGNHVTTLHVVENPTADTMTTFLYSGEDTTGDLLKKEELTYTDRGAKKWDYTLEKKIFTANLDASGNIGALVKTSHTQKKFIDLSETAAGGTLGAKRTISYTQDFGGTNPLTTTTEYYLGTGNKYIDGRVKSTLNPDGSWVYYEYTLDTNSPTGVEKRYTSWKNVPLANYTQGRLEETILTKNEITSTNSIAGVQVGKSQTSKSLSPSGESLLLEKTWTGSEWATSTTCYHPDAAANATEAGRMKWKEYADGTAATYSYSTNAGQLTITKRKGAGDRTGVTAGTEMSTTYNSAYKVISETSKDIESGLVTSTRVADLAHGVDNSSRPLKWIYNNNPNDYSITQYGCCGLEFSRDRSGATSTYYRDDLKRVYRVDSKRSSTGATVSSNTTYSGLTNTNTRSSGNTTLFVSESTRSLSGLTFTSKSPDTDGDGQPEVSTRSTVYGANGGSTTTNTAPDGSTTVTVSFIDGSTKAATNQIGNTITYDKGTHTLNGGGLYSQMTQANGVQFTKSFRDQAGRNIRTELADGSHTAPQYYNFSTAPAGSRGKMHIAQDSDELSLAGSGSHSTYEYNNEGETVKVTRKLPDNQSSIQTSDLDVVNDPDLGISNRSRSWTNGILTSTSLQSITGYQSKSISFGRTTTSERSVPADGAWTSKSTAANGAFSIQTYSDGLMKKSASYAAGTTDLQNGYITQQTTTQDAFGRTLTSTDARTGTTTINGYLDSGAVTSVTAPGNRTTTITRDNMGRTILVDSPDTLDKDGNTISNISHTSYNPTGTVSATWGDQAYAKFHLYDAQNRLVELRTYKNLAHFIEPTISTAGSASTKWNYNPVRGWLDSKRDAENKGCDYTYTTGGRLKTKTLARGTVSTYSYDAGVNTLVSYSDTTPSVLTKYDNFGRPTKVDQGSGTNLHEFSYNPSTLLLTSEKITYGGNTATPFVRTLNRTQDNLLRPASTTLITDAQITDHQSNYSYDTAGRLSQITNPQISNAVHTYGYLAKSGGIIETITSPAHKVTNSYEADRNGLLSKQSSKLDNTAIGGYQYTMNHLGQRTSITKSGLAYSTSEAETIGYDAKGQVVKTDTASNAAFNRNYTFDGIGNRLTDGLNTYTVNNVNEIQSILKNSDNSVLNTTHDDDGNMLTGILPEDTTGATLEWDGQNRLTKITKSDGSIVEYAYDYQSRRISKTSNGSNVVFVYDGWNPIAKYTKLTTENWQLATLKKTYLWGQDINGGMQSAGGVGGLLQVNDHGSQVTSHYPLYDGNGNISDYVDTAGTVVAHYQYDAFGNTIVKTGAKADDFAHRFSTKQRDTETGLYYYGYRYYDPVTGRFQGRDPIEEKGGVNLYAFVGNDGLNYWDKLGLWETGLELDFWDYNYGNEHVATAEISFTHFLQKGKLILKDVSGDDGKELDDVKVWWKNVKSFDIPCENGSASNSTSGNALCGFQINASYYIAGSDWDVSTEWGAEGKATAEAEKGGKKHGLEAGVSWTKTVQTNGTAKHDYVRFNIKCCPKGKNGFTCSYNITRIFAKNKTPKRKLILDDDATPNRDNAGITTDLEIEHTATTRTGTWSE